jgi:pre-rRNA-processing protein TSR4
MKVVRLNQLSHYNLASTSMASLALTSTLESSTPSAKGNAVKVKTLEKYRQQLLRWKTDKIRGYAMDGALRKKHLSQVDYEQYLDRKIRKKLVPLQTDIEPTEIRAGLTQLGFVQSVELESHLRNVHTNKNWLMWDGGKVGGSPSWLNSADLPHQKDLLCTKCRCPMMFLLQIYAPLDGPEFDHCFHRTLYVFCCGKPECLGPGQGFLVLRCQLPRVNSLYANEIKESDEEPLITPIEETSIANRKVFPLFEIITESEIDCLDDSNITLMKKFEDTAGKVTVAGNEEDLITESDIKECMDGMSAVQDGVGKMMTNFHHRVAVAKDQCLRYCRWNVGEELWVSDMNRPDVLEGIPPCPYCHGPRRFEFQIMPQLVFHLDPESSVGTNDFDWGIIAVYTCIKSCNVPSSYTEEFAWHQPMGTEKEK